MRALVIWARPSLVISFSNPTVLPPEKTWVAMPSTRVTFLDRMSEARSTTASIRFRNMSVPVTHSPGSRSSFSVSMEKGRGSE